MSKAEKTKAVDRGPHIQAIVRNLKELRDTSKTVHDGAVNIIPILKKVFPHVKGYKKRLLKLALDHYKRLAKAGNAWAEINEKSLSDETSIYELFNTLATKLDDPVKNRQLFERQESYAWISINYKELNEIIVEHNNLLTPQESIIVRNDLIKPVTRLTKIELLTRNLKEEAAKINFGRIKHITEKLYLHIKRINHKVQQDLVLLELHSLENKINVVDDENLKEKLDALYAQLHASFTTKHALKKSSDQIDQSKAMKLCRSANDMLKVLLESDYKKKTLDERLDAVNDFKQIYKSTAPTQLWKTGMAVAIAAVVSAVVLALIVGVAAIVGTCIGGPAGTVAGAVVGVFTGAETALGVGVVVASIVTGVTVASASSPFLFKHSKKTEAAKDVAKAATQYVFNKQH